MKRNSTIFRIVLQRLIACLVVCFLVLVTSTKSRAQVTGDFRSIASGNWNVSTTWERFSSGSVWEASGTGENAGGLTPAATNAVFIQSGHTVALTQNEACNDLHIANGTVAALGTRGIVDVSTFTLNVNGKLRAYFATVGTVPGTASTGGYTAYPFLATTGKISIVGNSRTVLASTDWGATITTSSANFPLEINMNSGQTATLAANIKASSINFVAGTVDGQSYSLDNGGGAGFGDATIASGATVISSGNGTAVFQRTGTTLAGTLTVNGTLRLTGAAPVFRMTAINFNGTVEYPQNTQALAISGSSGANPVTYNNLTIGGSSSAVKTTAPGLVTTVNGKLLLNSNGAATITIGAGGSLAYGATATLEYQTTSSRVVGAEWPAIAGPFNVSIASASALSFAASTSTSRTIAGTFTMGGGNFTVNATNTLVFANGANIIRNAGQLNLTSGTVNHGVIASDLVNVSINVTSNSSGEISSNVTPGKIGTLTIGTGVSYTNTGGRTVTNLVNNGILVLTPGTTLTLTVGGAVSGPGTITSNLSTGNPANYYSSSLAFTGASAAGTLLMTPGFNVIRNLTLNNPGGLTLGNAIKVDTTLNLTAGTLNTGGNLSLGNGTGIVRTAGTVSAAPVFGTSVNVTYNETGATTTGPEFPASSTVLNNLTINNSNGISLNSSPTVNGTLALTAGFLSIGSNTLTAKGAITGAGTLSGSATSNLIIAAGAGTVNFTSGSQSLNNLSLGAAGSAVLGTALDIYGVVGFTAGGNLNMNAQAVTLKSTAAATARVGNLTGSTLSGASNVTVERYINSDVVGRKWHLLSGISTASGQTIRQSWQENGGAVSNLGTWITSGTSSLPGYDATSANSASILGHDSLSGNWVTPAATDAGLINDRPGYMVFVRGDRNALPSNALTAPTVLRTTGTLRQGTQTGVTILNSNPQYTMLGNPYASPIDFEAIAGTTNLFQSFYVWDASYAGASGVGGFRLVQRTGVNTYTATPTTGGDNTLGFIHSGQAFFVKTNGSGDANVVFDESSKVSSLSVVNPIVAASSDQQIYTSLIVMGNGNTETLADAVRVRYSDAYTAATTDDALKMGNFGQNISSYRDDKKWIVELRPMIAKTDTIFLSMSGMTANNYRFKVSSIDFVQPDVKAWLQDAFTGKSTPLDLAGNTLDIDFSVTGDAASANSNRFRIVFENKMLQPQISTIVRAAQQGAVIAVDWKASNQYNMKQYEVEKSTDGVTYTKVNTSAAIGVNGSNADYNWLDVNPAVGDNYYRIRSISITGDAKISQPVVVTITKGNRDITVYPNPVTGRKVSLKFTDMEKGIYQLRLLNANGQVVLTKAINHTGGSAIQTVLPGSKIARGSYWLEITKADNTKTSQAIFITE